MSYKHLFLLYLLTLYKTCKAQTVTDFDGNIYNTVTIGTQTWMKENLQTTHFNNGISIPTTTNAVLVNSTSLFQWAYNNDTNFINPYGRLYTWFTVAGNNNVCPTGWHVPGSNEWLILSNYLGGDTLAGKKMKEPGLLHWASTDSSVTNSSSFTGLPGGKRGNPMGFSAVGTHGAFWSSTPAGSSSFQRGACFLLYPASNPFKNQFLESLAVANCGMSVRCLMNVPNGIETIRPEKETQLFPNPFTNDITVNFESTAIRTLIIYNTFGEIVFQKKLADKANTIELNTLESGTYILKIIENNSVTERKIIKK